MCLRNFLNKGLSLLVFMIVLAVPGKMLARTVETSDARSGVDSVSTATTAGQLGISFIDGSSSEVLVVRNGRQFIVDVANHTIREVERAQSGPPGGHVVQVAISTARREAGESSSRDGSDTAPSSDNSDTAPSGDNAQTQSPSPSAPAEKKKTPRIYTPGDDLVFSVPTGRRLERHGFYINFSHRFPFEAAFVGPGRGNVLLGLDDFSVSSFGFRYGVTSKLSVMAYRSPSVIGRPIELMAAYNFLDESDGKPLNAAVRLSIDGQNNFTRNFTENIELTVSRSLGHRAQLYAVPTFSIRNRPLLGDISAPLQNAVTLQSCNLALAAGVNPALGVRPCANTFSLGLAVAVDVRPTVALVAETIPTLVNGPELGIHRAPFAFGVQKKIWRHAFTLGLTNSPGTTVSQRAGTNATFLQQPGADKPSQMFFGFDITRQVY
jgi:hypothetical protein